MFTRGQNISAGNFIINIGSFDTTDVAIISKSTGAFTKIKQAKVSKKLRKVKRVFKSFINNPDTFVMQHLDSDQVRTLLQILK